MRLHNELVGESHPQLHLVDNNSPNRFINHTRNSNSKNLESLSAGIGVQNEEVSSENSLNLRSIGTAENRNAIDLNFSDVLNEDEESESTGVLTLYLPQQEIFSGPANQKDYLTEINFIPAKENEIGDRAKTAPPRPPTVIEEFRASQQFLNLETASIAGSQLIQKSEDKFDFESEEGQSRCKSFLLELEKLSNSFQIKIASRNYRNKFSNAYKILYKADTLCYLIEILDSAQESIYYLSLQRCRFPMLVG